MNTLRLVLQTVLFAIGQILRHKMRSLLTTLGVIIGVAAVLGVIAALSGLQRSVLKEFETLGVKRVWIDGELPDSLRNRYDWRDVQLQEDEIEAIGERCPSIEFVAPMFFLGGSVEYGQKRVDSIGLSGIVPAWHTVENRQVITGRPFNSVDLDQRSSVCLVNDVAIDELELPKDPTGEVLLLNGRRFMIVGVVETITRSAMFGGGDTSIEVWIPFTTARALRPEGWINFAWAQLRAPDLVEDAKLEIRTVLRQMRGLGPDEEDTFQIRVLQQFIDQFNRLAATILAAASGIVGITLLVGGIGIMNIMLVSVSERTREIGLRKSLGARPEAILLQFLIEAIVLCLAGALVGLLTAMGLIAILRSLPNGGMESAMIPPWAIGLAVGFSAFIGVVFGMFPALKAARLNPIDALRHE